MSEEKDEWYVSRSGQRFGPVTFARMMEAASAGRLEPRTDMVIGGGLKEWKPAGEVEGLFKAPGVERQGGLVDHDVASDPMPVSEGYDDAGEDEMKPRMPGVSRLAYFLGVVVLPVLMMTGPGLLMPQLEPLIDEAYVPWVELMVFLIPFSLLIVIVVKRFENLAMSGAWFLGIFVPLLNWWVGYRLFACPPGYHATKKLDGIGKFLAAIYWSGPVLAIAAAFLFAGKIAEAKESGTLDEPFSRYELHRPSVPRLEPSESAP
ncbi:GYF domain-containing protein [Haloferula chungangensis]|uniref:GYF domain-containing protein n=1 Tax=Haloferula chungangensis TaxID=1048331 RepID=A0ABW2L4A4_9BACT